MLNDDEQFYMEREFTGWGNFNEDDEELDDIDDYDSDPEYDYPGLESMRGDDETMHYRAG